MSTKQILHNNLKSNTFFQWTWWKWPCDHWRDRSLRWWSHMCFPAHFETESVAFRKRPSWRERMRASSWGAPWRWLPFTFARDDNLNNSLPLYLCIFFKETKIEITFAKYYLSTMITGLSDNRENTKRDRRDRLSTIQRYANNSSQRCHDHYAIVAHSVNSPPHEVDVREFLGRSSNSPWAICPVSK